MATRLVWPNVLRPRVPIVYLDLNHIVAIARVRAGNLAATKDYSRLFESALRAANEQRAVFPISGSHVWEIAKLTDPRQRDELASVLEPLTGYQYLMGQVPLAELEFEAGVAAVTGVPTDPLGYPLLRGTIGHAFGLVGGLKVVDEDGRDTTEEARRSTDPAEFDRQMAEMNLQFERMALRGPSDDEVDELRAEFGYRPEVALATHESRVEFERETARQLDERPEWRRGRLRDFIAGREFTHEWIDVFARVRLDRQEAGLPALSDDQMRDLLSSIPQAQVAISLKTRFHQNRALSWTANRVTDIDAVSVAYAYCEAVFTDNEVRNALLTAPELRSLGTFVPRRPGELSEWLDSLPHRVAPDMLVPHPLHRSPL